MYSLLLIQRNIRKNPFCIIAVGGRNWSSVCTTAVSIVNKNTLLLDKQHNRHNINSLLQLSSYHQYSSLPIYRGIHTSSWLLEKGEPLKPSSKIEVTVQKLKEDLKPASQSTPITPITTTAGPVVKKSLWEKVKDECRHYYHGFRLLFIDINISRKLLWRVLRGKSLTRREHKQLVTTVSDLFRLVPFSVFIIVPFMEFLLPVAIKLFPGMLPSTFQTAKDKEAKLQQALKVKLEMAKFLQQTLDNMSLQSKGHHSDTAQNFAEFFRDLRKSGADASTEEILRFCKLFEDEITLDTLTRPQLIALCKLLEMQSLGTNNFLRFQLRMRLRSLAADDKLIMKEGIDVLTIPELERACRARGMRSYGLTAEALRSQLTQWLDLSLNEKVPPSLLLLSRVLTLPVLAPTKEQIKATITALPDVAVAHAKATIGEMEGKVDNKTKLELIKEEERKIQEERRERREEEAEKRKQKETLVDTTTPETLVENMVLQASSPESSKLATEKNDLSSKDFAEIEDALDTISKKKLIVEKEELEDLKEEMAEYKEDLDDLKKVTTEVKAQVKESKAASALYRKVNVMINKMDAVLGELDKEKKELATKLSTDAKENEQIVTIADLMDSIKQIQKIPDEYKLQRISDVLSKMDDDRDGAIKVDDVLKVIEMIGKENVKLSPKQVDEIIDLLNKEEVLEAEKLIEKTLDKKLEEKDNMDDKFQSISNGTSSVPSDPHEVSKKEKVVIAAKKDAKIIKEPTGDNQQKL